MFRSLPPLAVFIGVIALIPAILLGLTSLSAHPARAASSVQLLVDYGAVILSFLGAVHWGFTLGMEDDENSATHARLVLGTVPAAIAFGALVLLTWGTSDLALATLVGGFAITIIGETRARRLNLVPAGYMILRWVLTIALEAVFIPVLVLHMIGAHILL